MKNLDDILNMAKNVQEELTKAQANLDTPLVFACLLTITLFTSAGVGAIAAIEWAWLGWRPSRRRS